MRGVAGAFVAQNALLFFLFYELELIPLYLLIAVWGGAPTGLCRNQISDLYRYFRHSDSGDLPGVGMVEWVVYL